MKKKILLNGIIVGEHESSGDHEQDIQAIRAYLQKKGLWKETTRNDSMFGQANSFAETANLLYRKNLKTSPFKGSAAAPFVVNAAFSVEIYLKTIHDAHGKDVTGHDLEELYEKLNQETKNIVLSAAEDIKDRYDVGVDSIEKCLSSLSRAFVEWRYLYEHQKLSTEIQSIRYTMHTAFEATYRVREALIRGQCKNEET